MAVNWYDRRAVEIDQVWEDKGMNGQEDWHGIKVETKRYSGYQQKQCVENWKSLKTKLRFLTQVSGQCYHVFGTEGRAAAMVEDAQRSVIKEYISLKHSIHLFIRFYGQKTKQIFKKWILPMDFFPSYVYLTHSLVLLTHKAYTWIQCNSLHPLFQWKSHMCVFPSASWPAWTWLAGCLDKWHDINKTVPVPKRSLHVALLSRVWLHRLDATTIIKPKNTSSKHHSEPLLRVDTVFRITRHELTVSTSMCVQGSMNKDMYCSCQLKRASRFNGHIWNSF